MKYTQQHRDNFTEYVKKYIAQFQDVDVNELPWIETYTGRKWRHLKPQASDVSIVDIAHALSGITRYTGHLAKLYSVGQHSVLASKVCDPEDALEGLLHDASEAYCNDLSRPFKRSPGMEVYKVYENMTQAAICEHFGISSVEPESVKRADMILLATEKRDLMPDSDMDWKLWAADKEGKLVVLHNKIVPWTQAKAEKKFMARYLELTRGWRNSV